MVVPPTHYRMATSKPTFSSNQYMLTFSNVPCREIACENSARVSRFTLELTHLGGFSVANVRHGIIRAHCYGRRLPGIPAIIGESTHIRFDRFKGDVFTFGVLCTDASFTCSPFLCLPYGCPDNSAVVIRPILGRMTSASYRGTHRAGVFPLSFVTGATAGYPGNYR
jgi:hypothetical protein